FEPHDLLRHNICHQAIFTKKSVLEELGGFDLKYPLIADYVTNLKIFLSTKYKITYIDKVIAYYGSLGKSYSPWSEEERNSFYSLRSKLWNEYCNKKILIYKKNFFAKIVNFFRK
ncbi:MAG: hypothetical protein NZ455_16280, partial [Bacteroidia bacterium]|nr:hypothetical protein [Bacteroidia bacterium]